MSALAPPRPRIGAGEVHVWTASLDPEPHRLETLARTLSSDELAKARRFRFDRDRDRFVAGRGTLRALLAEYLETDPADLVFRYGPFGRPELDRGEIAFNLAHAESSAIYAFAARGPVGVDIERCGANALADRVPEHFFSQREVAALRALPEAEQELAFLRCWTRKEAYLKAQGTGLALPLYSFAVALAPRERPAITWTAWSTTEPSKWRLHDVSAYCDGHVAAVAVDARTIHVVGRKWPEDTEPPSLAATEGD